MCNLDSLPPRRVHDHFGPASSGCCRMHGVILRVWCSECTWGNFKTCITVRVCVYSASHRQLESWHKADRHHRTESHLQKQGFYFFLNQGMGKKNPIQNPSEFQTLGVQAGNEVRRGNKEKRRKFFKSQLYFWSITSFVLSLCYKN